MPDPVSAMVIVTAVPVCAEPMVMVPPLGIAAAAFSTKLDTTCANCTWSMRSMGSASDKLHWTETRCCSKR